MTENPTQHEYTNLWDELQLMKEMKPHENIVNLLGHCTTTSECFEVPCLASCGMPSVVPISVRILYPCDSDTIELQQ